MLMAMHLILDSVATHGIGEPGIVGHYVDCQIGFIDDFRIIIDVSNAKRRR